MAKYKYKGGSNPRRTYGTIYDGESKLEAGYMTVDKLASNYPEDWELIAEKSPEELLIEEAKIRYPIGTKFIPTMRGPGKSFVIIKNLPFLTESGGFIQDGPGGCSIYRAYDKKWAEIINEEPMCTEKTIKLSLNQAKKMYGKSPEMDELLLANFSKEELTKKELPKRWIELKISKGFKVSNKFNGSVESLQELYGSRYENTSIFATEKQACSALAMAQLSQLMAVYNDGWEQLDPKANQNRYVINLYSGKISKNMFVDSYHFLTFKTAELRDEFLKNFEPLIKEYFMID